jgi:hypothetical protein
MKGENMTKQTYSYRWRPVSSSWIDAVKHENGRVKIRLSNGLVYSYADASGQKWFEMVDASSKGGAFNEYLKRTLSGNLRAFQKH